MDDQDELLLLRGASDHGRYAVELVSRKQKTCSLYRKDLEKHKEYAKLENKGPEEIVVGAYPESTYTIRLYKAFPEMPYDDEDAAGAPDNNDGVCIPYQASKWEAESLLKVSETNKKYPVNAAMLTYARWGRGKCLRIPDKEHKMYTKIIARLIDEKGFMVNAYSQIMPTPKTSADEQEAPPQAEVESDDDDEWGANRDDAKDNVETTAPKGRMLAFDIDCKIRCCKGDPNLDGGHLLSERARQLGAYIAAVVYKLISKSKQYKASKEKYSSEELCTNIVTQRQVNTVEDPRQAIRFQKFCVHIYFPNFYVTPDQQVSMYSFVATFLSFSCKDSLAGLECLGVDEQTRLLHVVDNIGALRSYGCIKGGTACTRDSVEGEGEEKDKEPGLCKHCNITGVPAKNPAKAPVRSHFSGYGGNYRFVDSFTPRNCDLDTGEVTVKSSSLMSGWYQHTQAILDSKFITTCQIIRDKVAGRQPDPTESDPIELDMDGLIATNELVQNKMRSIVHKAYQCGDDNPLNLQLSCHRVVQQVATGKHIRALCKLVRETSVNAPAEACSIIKFNKPSFDLEVIDFAKAKGLPHKGAILNDYTTTDANGFKTEVTSYADVYTVLGKKAIRGGGNDEADPGEDATEKECRVIKWIIESSSVWRLVKTDDMSCKKHKKGNRVFFYVTPARAICLKKKGEHTSNRCRFKINSAGLFYSCHKCTDVNFYAGPLTRSMAQYLFGVGARPTVYEHPRWKREKNPTVYQLETAALNKRFAAQEYTRARTRYELDANVLENPPMEHYEAMYKPNDDVAEAGQAGAGNHGYSQMQIESQAFNVE